MVEEILWNDEPALLIKGDLNILQATRALRDAGFAPADFEIGPVERFRRWPGQWNEHIDRNKSESIIGTFKARLAT